MPQCMEFGFFGSSFVGARRSATLVRNPERGVIVSLRSTLPSWFSCVSPRPKGSEGYCTFMLMGPLWNSSLMRSVTSLAWFAIVRDELRRFDDGDSMDFLESESLGLPKQNKNRALLQFCRWASYNCQDYMYDFPPRNCLGL